MRKADLYVTFVLHRRGEVENLEGVPYEKITVLGLNNNFFGSYSSNQVFFEEMLRAFRKKGIRVVTASTVEEAVERYETDNISFSISFSKYRYYSNGVPLYDLYQVLNYQWVSDNPLKMNLDEESKWIQYIFIDEEYPLVLNKQAVNEYFFRPLGFLEENLMSPGEKNGRILVPCKIRNLNQIAGKIKESSKAGLMKRFLEEYERGSSYIRAIHLFFRREGITDYAEKEMIFRLTNEYTRIEKRLWVIEHIELYPVDVLSEDCNNFIKNRNVTFLQPVPYSMMQQLINSYEYVINVDPNYHACIHDRFIKAVSSGTVCITNKNNWTDTISSATYSFDEPYSIMDAVNGAEYNDIYEKQRDAILPYSWEKSAQLILEDYLKGWNDAVSNTV